MRLNHYVVKSREEFDRKRPAAARPSATRCAQPPSSTITTATRSLPHAPVADRRGAHRQGPAPGRAAVVGWTGSEPPVRPERSLTLAGPAVPPGRRGIDGVGIQGKMLRSGAAVAAARTGKNRTLAGLRSAGAPAARRRCLQGVWRRTRHAVRPGRRDGSMGWRSGTTLGSGAGRSRPAARRWRPSCCGPVASRFRFSRRSVSSARMWSGASGRQRGRRSSCSP